MLEKTDHGLPTVAVDFSDSNFAHTRALSVGYMALAVALESVTAAEM